MTSHSTVLVQYGFVMCVAVLFDTFVVRSLMVPVSMVGFRDFNIQYRGWEFNMYNFSCISQLAMGDYVWWPLEMPPISRYLPEEDTLASLAAEELEEPGL